MAMNTSFSYRLRVLACDGCGAAVELPHGGGHGRCHRCGSPMAAPIRPETAVPRSPPMQDQVRMTHLRQQDGRPVMRPPGLEALVSPAGEIDAWKLGEARQIWGATRAHLRSQPSDLAAAERLVFLTMALSNTMAGSGDDLGLRALYEGALEVLALPRHRQLMRGYLARNATRLGDVESAQAWLAGCDPGSDDLQTDSVYRITHAYISTAMNDPQSVLRVLGGSEADVPIHDAMDPIAVVLRANAWERMGNVEAARGLLARFMTSQGGLGAAVESVAKVMPAHWQVCAQALQGARMEHRRHVARRAGSGAWAGWVLLASGLALAVVVVSGAISDPPDARELSTGPVIVVLLFAVLLPAGLGLLGLRMIQGAKRQKIIAESGLQGQARVLALDRTGTEINDVPVMRIDVEVRVAGRPPFRASTKKLMQPHEASMLIGREVPILWHPKYPGEVVLEV